MLSELSGSDLADAAGEPLRFGNRVPATGPDSRSAELGRIGKLNRLKNRSPENADLSMACVQDISFRERNGGNPDSRRDQRDRSVQCIIAARRFGIGSIPAIRQGLESRLTGYRETGVSQASPVNRFLMKTRCRDRGRCVSINPLGGATSGFNDELDGCAHFPWGSKFLSSERHALLLYRSCVRHEALVFSTFAFAVLIAESRTNEPMREPCTWGARPFAGPCGKRCCL